MSVNELELVEKLTLQAHAPCGVIAIDMRFRNLLALIVFVASVQAELKPHFVLLPHRAAHAIKKGQKTWDPSQGDINAAEANITQVASLKAEGWSSVIHIDHPEHYFRQYVGIRRAGKSFIYLNAFCDEKPPDYWRKRLVIVMDGATCYWQALYDPATRLYSHLTINGRA